MNEYLKLYIKSIIFGFGLILGVFAVILILTFIDDLATRKGE